MKKILTLVLFLFCTFAFVSTIKGVDAVTDYYASTEGLEGKELLNELALISQENHSTYNSYGDSRNMFVDTDRDPNKDGNLLDFYTQVSLNATWDGGATYNREHVWPKSLSGGLYTETDNSDKGAGADIHHIRPTIENINSSRGNKLYTDFDMEGLDFEETKYDGMLVAYTNSQCWEPLDFVKGDVARIIMYLYMHYSNEIEANETFSYAGNLAVENVIYSNDGSDGAWEILLEWNKIDPVDAFEENRNNECYQVTKVRNPFIDNEDFATLIWGDASDLENKEYKVTYSYDNGVIFDYIDNNFYSTGSLINKPSKTPIKNGYVFLGWSTVANDKKYIWDFNTDTISNKLTLYAIWEESNSGDFVENVKNVKSQLLFNYEEEGTYDIKSYDLVTDINDLESGDNIIIVNNENSLALSTVQNSNNRGTTSVEIANNRIDSISSDVQVIKLEDGVNANTFAFNVGSGYLYAVSSSKNQLKTKSSFDGNGSWNIEIASDGNATIKATGTVTRNWLRLNPNNGSPIFSCYGSGQKDVAIYKESITELTAYNLTEKAIKFSYYVSNDVFRKYDEEFALGFTINSENYIEDVMIEELENGLIKVSVVYFDIKNFEEEIEVIPTIFTKEDYSVVAYADVISTQTIKSLASSYLYVLNDGSLDENSIQLIKKFEDVLNYIISQ